MENKFKLYPKKIISAVCSVAFVATLASCAGKTAENKIQDTNTDAIENTETQDTNTETVENTETQDEDQTYLEEVDGYLDTQTEKDSAADAAISMMLDGAKQLEDSAQESVNSDAFQEELARSLQNFKDLSDFIFNGGEINGVTFSELSESGQEKARNALSSLDDVLNYLVPNYRERFRNWFTGTTANGLDTLENLRDEGLELWNEIKSKRNTK